MLCFPAGRTVQLTSSRSEMAFYLCGKAGSIWVVWGFCEAPTFQAADWWQWRRKVKPLRAQRRHQVMQRLQHPQVILDISWRAWFMLHAAGETWKTSCLHRCAAQGQVTSGSWVSLECHLSVSDSKMTWRNLTLEHLRWKGLWSWKRSREWQGLGRKRWQQRWQQWQRIWI